jgi:Tol biopolymer transport system component
LRDSTPSAPGIGPLSGRLILPASTLFCLFATIAFAPRSLAQSNSSDTPHQVFRIVYHRESTFSRYAMDAPIFKNIYMVNTNGGAEEKLTEDNHSFAPVLSPDGSRIAYIHITPETCEGCLLPAKYELYVMNADGSDPHFVAPLDGPLPFLRWSPDGHAISYGGWPRRQPQPLTFSGSTLYLASLGSSESPRLLNQNVIGPFAWSPDGKWIAHGCATEQTQARARIRLCLSEVANTGNSRMLPDGASLSGVSWSPDSKHIAFVVWEKNTKSIFVAGTDASSPRVLTDTSWIFCQPHWSPDGQKILFEDTEKRKGAIFVINSDGSNRNRLTGPKLKASGPVWSPDGSKIAFARKVDAWLQVHLMNADGSGLRQITHDKKMGYSVRAWLPGSSLLLLACGHLELAYPDPTPVDVRLCVLDVNDPSGAPRELAKDIHTAYSFAQIPSAPKSAAPSTP